MKFIEAIAKRLSELLAEKGISQYSLAKKVALNETVLYNILHGRVKTVTVDTLALIADGLGLSVQEFLDHPLFARDALDI